ncbi:hypothetical protein FQR65_LT20878 [Abscondita terminalis]|nr:hypothetical protein FQR65_LT20878 [Abscondita terminalis]
MGTSLDVARNFWLRRRARCYSPPPASRCSSAGLLVWAPFTQKKAAAARAKAFAEFERGVDRARMARLGRKYGPVLDRPAWNRAASKDRISALARRILSPNTGPLGVMSVAVAAGVIEIASMLPYLVGMTKLADADISAPSRFALLAAYCLVMVLPALVLLIIASSPRGTGELRCRRFCPLGAAHRPPIRHRGKVGFQSQCDTQTSHNYSLQICGFVDNNSGNSVANARNPPIALRHPVAHLASFTPNPVRYEEVCVRSELVKETVSRLSHQQYHHSMSLELMPAGHRNVLIGNKSEYLIAECTFRPKLRGDESRKEDVYYGITGFSGTVANARGVLLMTLEFFPGPS